MREMGNKKQEKMDGLVEMIFLIRVKGGFGPQKKRSFEFP